MSFLDSVVSKCFRDSEVGRTVVFPNDSRKRAYLVRSESDERKIRGFLKVFFSAHFSLLLLTYLDARCSDLIVRLLTHLL